MKDERTRSKEQITKNKEQRTKTYTMLRLRLPANVKAIARQAGSA